MAGMAPSMHVSQWNQQQQEHQRLQLQHQNFLKQRHTQYEINQHNQMWQKHMNAWNQQQRQHNSWMSSHQSWVKSHPGAFGAVGVGGAGMGMGGGAGMGMGGA